MSWCKDNKVDYILGVAKNERLKKIIGRQLYAARKRHEDTGRAARYSPGSGTRPRRAGGRKDE